MWVRRVRCHVCGGPKVTPSRTAHDHCSWCGAFADWNHAVAYATRGSMLPGPRYEALRTYLQPQLEEARRRGHFANLTTAYRQLYALHVTDCPAAYSPRISDPVYRAAVVEYHAMRDAARLVDAPAMKLEAEMARVSRTMFYVDRPEGRFVRSDRFFAVLQAFLPLQERLDSLLRVVGAIEVHPDAPPLSLLQKIGRSAFVQEWMPLLEHETGLAALESTGLKDQYEELHDFVVRAHECPHCHAEVPVVDGARAVLCEGCGTLVGGERVVRCGGCGGGFTPTPGALELACPYCQRVVDASALR